MKTSKALSLLSGAMAALAAVVAYRFGSSIGWDMLDAQVTGGVMAIVSLVAYFLPDRAVDLWLANRRWLAGSVMALAAICILWDAVSAFSFSATNRANLITSAKVQNAVYDDNRSNVAEAKALLATFTDRLEKLESSNAWVTVTTADALRAKLASMEGDKVFKRSKGCANVTIAESRAFCDKRAEIQGQIAISEERGNLSKQIEATRKVVEDTRSKASHVDAKVEGASSQALALASLGTGTMKPGEEPVYWTMLLMSAGMAILMAIAGLLKAIGNENLTRLIDPESPHKEAAPLAKTAMPVHYQPTVRKVESAVANRFNFSGFTLPTAPGLGVLGKLREAA